MELSELIRVLAEPAAYPFPVEQIELRQTHISVVFIAGDFVYKLKKPVDYGFLDFSTLDKRRFYCEEEVRLNRRLAPEVYIGVVPISFTAGRACFEGTGTAIEWAVKMRRLPDEATLQSRLQARAVDVAAIRAIAGRIASFHAHADGGSEIAKFARFEVVAGNARENFVQTQTHVGRTVSRSVFERVRALTEELLLRLQPLIESRAARGIPRDTHGDLQLGHVYLFPKRSPPNDLVVLDCIEFSERFRFADPIADMAFLVMGLKMLGQRAFSREFLEAYLQYSGDDEGRALLPFYTAYRAVVRAKVEGLKFLQAEISPNARATSLTNAQCLWLLALGELEQPSRRPCMLLVAGLPGTGKSTLARALADRANFQVIRSDVVRKELVAQAELDSAGEHSMSSRPSTVDASPTSTHEQGLGKDIYNAEWNRRTYAECLRRSTALLSDGKRVLIDANFREAANRRLFLNAATQLGVPAGLTICHASPEVVRARLAKRRDDASDADWTIYKMAAQQWEEAEPHAGAYFHKIETGAEVAVALDDAVQALGNWGLAELPNSLSN